MDYNESITIAFATSGSVYAEFASSIMKILLARKENIHDVIAINGVYITENRSIIVEKFLESSSDWLFFFDTDIVIKIEDFDILVDAADKKDYPILGGKYFVYTLYEHTREDELNPSLLHLAAQKKGPTSGVGSMGKWMDDYPSDTIVDDLHSMGMGYVLIHRSVFEKIKKNNPQDRYPWFKHEWRDNWGVFITEDIWFYEQCRILDINIAIHTGTSSQHIKKLPIREENLKGKNVY